MSTDYTVEISSSSGETTIIKVVDSIVPIPGMDNWTAEEPEYWAVSGGKVSNWGAHESKLGGPYGAESIVLEAFGKGTVKGDHGTGRKNYAEGTMPGGEISWTCREVL